jgi:protease II
MRAQVPVSVVHKHSIVRLDGSDPLLMSAYGAYGTASDADFDARRLSLLDRWARLHDRLLQILKVHISWENCFTVLLK